MSGYARACMSSRSGFLIKMFIFVKFLRIPRRTSRGRGILDCHIRLSCSACRGRGGAS